MSAAYGDSYRQAEYVVKSHECPDCRGKSRLGVHWDGKQNAAWCAVCGRTDGFRKRESLTARWRRDPDSIPTEVRNKLENKYGGEAMSEQALARADETALAKRIEGARWLADLQPRDKLSLAHLSVKYGLDPLMREMTIYEGAPYITVAGLLRIAHRQPQFAGVEDRPMTEEERGQYHYKAPYCWITKVYRSDWKCAAVGTGTADPNNPLRNNPVERVRPEWMSRSRALRQALKLAFPHSLPFDEIESAEERGIDPETGEILERQSATLHMVEVAVEEPAAGDYTEDGSAPSEPPAEQPAPTATTNDPKLLARWDALWREATDLGLKPEARPHRCSDADLTAKGKGLNALIEAEKNRRHAAAQEGQGSF